MKIRAYKNYSGQVEIDLDTVLVSLWNAYIEADEAEGRDKIYLNNKGFFENSFENAYDAAWAVSLSGKWNWTDNFVYFDKDGYLTSFSHWNDENSPIDIDKIDVGLLIDGLKKWSKNKTCKQGQENNISRAIHDALK